MRPGELSRTSARIPEGLSTSSIHGIHMDVPRSQEENSRVTLLERESQLGSLLQYADEARACTGRLVLISGEAGVGKSSLVEELQHRLPEATWAWGACDGLFTPRPLAPLHDIAREVGGALLDVVRESAP